MKFDLEYIEKLVRMIDQSSLTELVLEDDQRSIVLKKEQKVLSVQQMPVSSLPLPTEKQLNDTDKPASSDEKAQTENKPKGKPITSPMVGTFYKAPSPSAAPFVTVGDLVTPGQVVCIVEAMKLMNEIESEVSGRVSEICVEDGQNVEFGQVLMYVE